MVCIALNLRARVLLDHIAVKLMVLHPIMQHVSVVQHRVPLRPVSFAINLLIRVIKYRVVKPTVLQPIQLLVDVVLQIVLLILDFFVKKQMKVIG